jgi:hypothetical protein
MPRRASLLLALLTATLLLAAAACSDENGDVADPEVEDTNVTPDGGTTGETLPPLEGPVAVEVTDDPRACDPIDPRHCLLPFPSDFHTVADDSTDTGLRLDFARRAMPQNVEGVHVDPTVWNRADGFSPGSPIALWLEDVDLEASGAAPLTDLARSLDDDAPVVLLDADTGERHPYWVELDSTQPDRGLVVVTPARNFPDGHRIVVAVRGIVDGEGEPIGASDAFRAYRDRLDTGDPALERQRDRYERVFADLDAAGVTRSDLILAWDFTVASTRGLTETMLALRDDSFERLGERAPRFTVTGVAPGEDAGIARVVTGTFEMPNYLDGTGAPGERFLLDADTQLPRRNPKTPTFTATFRCIVPESALTGGEGARPVVYGHGLLGSEDEVDSSGQVAMATRHRMVYCATKWYGFSSEDVGNAVAILQDFSKFPTMVDRSQQGMLAQLWLARLMGHPDGLSSAPAFQTDDGTPVIDTDDVFFDGNSQGGIMGGAVTAVSTEWTRAVLGVPAMNYATLLRRSIDWETYRQIYDPAYPDELERTLGIYVAQILWDRFDANGYANHMTTDPLPGTPEHVVLMHVAFGDHQVSPYAADVEARTIGAAIHWPATADGRLPDVEPYWGIEHIERYPHAGSAVVVWDSGSPPPPVGNVEPTSGRDPHGDPRASADAQRQKSEFLSAGGEVVDVCDGDPCEAPPDD